MKNSFKSFLVLLFGMTLLSSTTWAYTEVPLEPETDQEDGGGSNNEDDREKSLREAAKAARDRATFLAIASGGVAIYFGNLCVQGNFGACAVTAVAISSAVTTAQYANDKQLGLNIRDPEEQVPEGGGGSGYCQNVHSCNEDSDPDPALTDQMHRLNRTNQMLEGAGFGVDKNGNIKTPKGTFSPDQMTPSTLASLGVTPELQAEFRAKMQEEIAKASAQREAGAIAGGGGGGPAKVLRAQRDNSSWSQNAPARGLASVDGLSVRRGDDLIGIQSADIFEMVHKKYQELRKNNTFME